MRVVFTTLALVTAVSIFFWQPAIHAASPADPTALLFNEIHARPAEGADGDANGDGARSPLEDEFVELVNTGDQELDLSGWTLADETSVRHTFPTGTTLVSKQALVVFGGGFPTGAFGGARVQLASSGALYLDNNFDTLTLSAPDGPVVVLSYDASLGAGQSITRNPDLDGPWTPHLEAGSGTARFSPGTTVDGRAFLPPPPVDEAPRLLGAVPAAGAQDVAVDAALNVTFSEAVAADPAAFDLDCSPAEDLALAISGGPIAYTLQPVLPLPYGRACTLTLHAEHITDSDASDPPDHPTADEAIHFRVAAADFLLINEIDALNALVDTSEFVEIYDGGLGYTSLDGLLLVLYDGREGSVYARYDLTGYQTDAAGYFVAGGGGLPEDAADLLLPDESLDNGSAAVALYRGDVARFPVGAPLDTAGVVDAVVYRAAGPETSTLLPLLLPGQPVANEDERDLAGYDSSQRCPNGSGGQRLTVTFGAAAPTPRQPNVCVRDEAPRVVSTTPPDGALRVPPDTFVSVTFSEEVSLYGVWGQMDCTRSGQRTFDVPVTGLEIPLPLDAHLAYGEACTVSLHAQQISDLDAADPPDHPLPFAWTFTVRPAEHILINEVDADTPGLDTAEFIELYDGGSGSTPLDGLVLALFNGSDDAVYRAIDLAGTQTDAAGYFVVTRETAGWMQNGPDAVALHAGSAAEFSSGTAVTTENLLDALVYSTDGEGDSGLQALLLPGEPQVNEDGRGAADLHSSQRCPNGAGGQRNTRAYLPNNPTPGKANNCLIDDAPAVAGVSPAPESTGIALNSVLTISFTEPVSFTTASFALRCDRSGQHELALSGGPLEFSLAPQTPFTYGETCQARVVAAAVRDLDAADPPDEIVADYVWSFNTAVRPVSKHILINEVDADTPGLDTAEFVELYDGGTGGTSLDGLVLVLYNGNDDTVYRTVDLVGMQTDAEGYFVVSRTAASWLQNGPDAVALYAGSAAEFPSGTAVTTENLLDALVYSTDGETDSGLQALLLPGEPQVNENGRGAADLHSSQRCPNGAGGQRKTTSLLSNNPTPGEANYCLIDTAPTVTTVFPEPEGTAVAVDATLKVQFTEPVGVTGEAFDLRCDRSGAHQLSLSGGPVQFSLRPDASFVQGETCQARVVAAGVRDLDAADPPDEMVADYVWSFSTAVRPVAKHILINEVDADTPGLDTAEFIELFDGGTGDTPLDGLALVLFNGSDDAVYRAIDLAGLKTNAEGYYVVRNTAAGWLQNGPDAVALFVGSAAEFPSGTAVTTANLLDALVYNTDGEGDPGLQPLLSPGQPQVNEDGRGAADLHSSQRCPNGEGGQRKTEAYLPNTPTPGEANYCVIDDAPNVSAVVPAPESTAVAVDAALEVQFTETVAVTAATFTLQCESSGAHQLTQSGGPVQFSLSPVAPFVHGETCQARVVARKVQDLDANDPPDEMVADYVWSFSTAVHPVARHILINEVDADTPGLDRAEFIELYDGGTGGTSLDGLALALYNGSDDAIYRVVALDGQRTDAAGFFLLAGPEVPRAGLALPLNTIQNGPDAVALYVADEAALRPGRGVMVAGLLDALVYHSNDDPDPGLLPLLLPGQTAVDEAAWRPAAIDSNQRCPHGQGTPRDSSAFLQNMPTPGAANNCQPDLPPSVSGVAPGEGAEGVSPVDEIQVSFSEAVQVKEGWLALTCGDLGNTIPLAISGGQQQFSATVEGGTLPPRSRCTAVIKRLYVTDDDGYADPLPADYTWQFSTGGHAFAQCGDPATPIHDLLLPDLGGAETGGSLVTIEAVVTGAFQGADALGGFFVQEEPADADSDLATADALFVQDSATMPEVSAGQVVRLQGEVTHETGLWRMSGVQAAQVCAGAVAIPAHSVVLPLADSDRAALRQGLLVEFAQPLTIIDTAEWATQGHLLLADGWQPYPTAVKLPGAEANALAEAHKQARLTLDDGRSTPNPDPLPYLGPQGTVRTGDLVLQLTGIFSPTATGEAYFQPTQPVQISHENTRLEPPPRADGRPRLALLDSGGFYNGDGQGDFSGSAGARTTEEWLRQRAKLASAMLAVDADIFAVTGIENDGDGAAGAAYDLVSALNDAAHAGPVYAVIHPQVDDFAVKATPAIIYRSDRVLPKGHERLLVAPPFAGHAPPLQQGFVAIQTGHEFALVILDLAARDGCLGPDADQGDGQGCGNARRTAQAAALVEWIRETHADDAERGVVVLGEFNAFAFEDPLRAFTPSGLHNLAEQYLGGSGYDRLHGGWVGSTRHAFASHAFAAEVAGVAQWHHNAAEPPALDYHLANPAALFQAGPYRAAPRDTLIIDLGTAELEAGFRSNSPQSIGRAVRFTNETTLMRPVSFVWDFGDGSSPATAVHPRHVYPAVGEYLVTLRATTAWGATASYSATVRIDPAQLSIPFVAAQP